MLDVEYQCCSRWTIACSADNCVTDFHLSYRAFLSLGIAHENFLWSDVGLVAQAGSVIQFSGVASIIIDATEVVC